MVPSPRASRNVNRASVEPPHDQKSHRAFTATRQHSVAASKLQPREATDCANDMLTGSAGKRPRQSASVRLRRASIAKRLERSCQRRRSRKRLLTAYFKHETL